MEEVKRQGLSIQAISEMTGFDRKTVRRRLIRPDGVPVYGPRVVPPGRQGQVDWGRLGTLPAEGEQRKLRGLDGRLPYPYGDEELRKMARDAFVSWQGSRYSLPWTYAGQEVWVRERGGEVEVHYGARRIAVHHPANGRHQVVRQAGQHEGIPLGA